MFLDASDEEELHNLSSTSSTTKAQLEIEIMDPRNEKKFESLAAKDEKLKTTYKRKHSGDLDTPTKRANDPWKLASDEEEEEKEEGELDDSRRGGQSRTRYWKTSREREPSESSSVSRKSEQETDPETLIRRQKQIDFGKNTIGYDNYRRQVPKNKRKPGEPRTPPLQQRYSRRAWDGLIKVWRKKLHDWDEETGEKKIKTEEVKEEEEEFKTEIKVEIKTEIKEEPTDY